ncbi:GumC family protein [Flavilitoribacter nigricans]|nr:Wzz/FepE/Etk N-terminal domain-containing protein [Flavilitoribacter nigricans]
MDILYFWDIIWRRKWLLIGTAAIAVVLTFFLIGLQPPVFKSNAVLSTGITGGKRIELSKQDVFVQKYEIESAFSNLIANMKSRTSLRLLAYRLLQHDLYESKIGGTPFREIPSDAEITSDNAGILRLMQQIQLRTDTLIVDMPLDPEDEATFKELTKAYEYDFESLDEHLHINRLGETDYVTIEFESENPELCVFAVNSFTEEFMDYHLQSVSRDEYEAVRFYENLALEKENRVKLVSSDLSNFRRDNNIVNMDEQSRSVVALLKDLEYERGLAKQGIPAHQKNIARLSGDLDQLIENESQRERASSIVKNRFSEIQGQIKDLRSEQPAGSAGLAPIYVNQLEFKRSYRDTLIDELANVLITSPSEEDAATIQNLLEKRVDEQILLTIKEESIEVIDEKIKELRAQTDSLVSAEERIDFLESQKEIAVEEYLYVLGKLNEAKVVAQSALNPLAIFEHAQIPEEPEPSKRLVYSAFSGVATAGFGVFILFFLTLLDKSFHSPAQFERLTGTPLLGALNLLPGKKRDLNTIFSESEEPDLLIFRESLRKIRHEIEVSGARRFLVTSTRPNVGKTSVLLSLAYTLAKKDKNVLLLDTNFKDNDLSDYANMDPEFNPLLPANNDAGDLITSQEIPSSKGRVDIIGNRPSLDSPSEILAGKGFTNWLEDLEQQYHYVLMEGPALNNYSDTRELVDYVDRVIVVFEASADMNRPDEESLRYLESLDQQYMGAILNKVNSRHLEN